MVAGSAAGGRVPGEALVTGRGIHAPSPRPRPSPAAGPPPHAVAAYGEPTAGLTPPGEPPLHAEAAPRVGVLALQGDVLEHLRMLAEVGADPVRVRTPADLDGLHGLVLPGGESTTIGRLLDLHELTGPVRAAIAAGLPTLGTCAGAILLAREARNDDGTPSRQPLLGVLDIVVRRNAFGRQVASAECTVDVAGLPAPMPAVFIRAPWIEEVGDEVEVLATVPTELGDKIVLARQGTVVACAFHPELAGDAGLHRLLTAAARVYSR